MAKYDYSVAVALAAQTGAGTYNAGLATVAAGSGTLGGHGGVGNTDEGLLIGDPEQGVRQSGLTLGTGRRSREKQVLDGSHTKGMSDFLSAEVRTFTFAVPFCGNRDDATTGTPVAADAIPLVGIDAMLEGVGMTRTEVSLTQRYRFQQTPIPISALIYYSGTKLELLDCFCTSLAINFTPGNIPIAVGQYLVGTVQSPTDNTETTTTHPTLSAPDQNNVSAPNIESVGNIWSFTRGFSSMVLTITPEIETVPDSNAVGGFVLEYVGRTVTLAGTLFGDDATNNEVYSINSVFDTVTSESEDLTFQVGDDMTSDNPVKSVTILAPNPETDVTNMDALGNKAGDTLSMIARSATANLELDITFS